MRAFATSCMKSSIFVQLRAATSLARLWQQQGKQKEAHAVLGDIYNWFAKGFNTKDLQEARGLIEELRQ
jgi:predicted ATPase